MTEIVTTTDFRYTHKPFAWEYNISVSGGGYWYTRRDIAATKLGIRFAAWRAGRQMRKEALKHIQGKLPRVVKTKVTHV